MHVYTPKHWWLEDEFTFWYFLYFQGVFPNLLLVEKGGYGTQLSSKKLPWGPTFFGVLPEAPVIQTIQKKTQCRQNGGHHRAQ